MTTRKPRYSKEEFARRGNEIYDHYIRAQAETANRGKIIAIDIETGDYEIADDTLAASDRLFERLPDAQVWFVRIGYPAVHRIGPRRLTEAR